MEPLIPLIRIERVVKHYTRADGQCNGDCATLRNVSLDVRRGEIFGIVGKSGAGKSTLLRMINLLETPDRGAVIVAGSDLTKLSKRDLRTARRNIGMVFQQYNLLHNLSVFDNVALPLRIEGALNAPRLRQRVHACLELVGIADKAGSYPAQLSGGQQQRVAIARALASQPEILLCDEPTSALDAETTRALLDTLRDLNAALGVTIVIVSHALAALATLCHRVAVIDNGAVAELFAPGDTGTPPITALGRELAFHGREDAVSFMGSPQHA